LPLIKLSLVFAFLLLLLRKKVGIATSILLGSIALGLLFGIEPSLWLDAALGSLTDPKLLHLAGIVVLILVLSEIMEKSGQNARLMSGISRFLVWRRLRLSFFPALIGLLPMPGGALFSAPMVKTASEGLSLTGEQKVMINYWFRHIWELVWPLYPGIILAASMTGIPLTRLLSLTWPSLPLALLIGAWFFLRPSALRLPPAPRAHPGECRPPIATLLIDALPLIMALAGALFLEGAIHVTGIGIAYEWGLLAALIAAIGISAASNRLSPRALLLLVSKRHLLRMIALILSIFVFKGVLENGGVVQEVGAVLTGKHALALTAIGLPMIMGLISGITMAFVGSTFPLILALMAQSPETAGDPTFIVLALFSGFTGVLASPLHICLLLTCEFFHVPLTRIWRTLLPPCFLFLALAAGYILILISLEGS
jgi:uncharacterized protein